MKLILFTSASERPRVIADSAIGRPVMPWFIPDFGENWRWRRATGVRIGRLGKGIAPKFAERYIDGMTAFFVAEADGCATLDFMDNSVVIGSWLEPEGVGETLPRLLVEASRYATLKTGDVIALLDPAPAEPITAGGQISLSLNSKETLKLNLK